VTKDYNIRRILNILDIWHCSLTYYTKRRSWRMAN